MKQVADHTFEKSGTVWTCTRCGMEVADGFFDGHISSVECLPSV